MEEIVRKGEIAYNKQFHFFQNVLFPLWYLFSTINALLNVVSICLRLDQSKIFFSGNGLNVCLLIQFKRDVGEASKHHLVTFGSSFPI